MVSLVPSAPKQHTIKRPITKKHKVETEYRKRTNKMYGYKWQKARERFLQQYPLCAQCDSEGKVEVAKVVDHITPHKGDMQLFWDKDNWQALCKPCHDSKTAREDGGFGNV